MLLAAGLTALACAGLGTWLGVTLADDAGSIAAIALACGVVGSFAPNAVRWALGLAHHRDQTIR